jgi:hypothetical protein
MAIIVPQADCIYVAASSLDARYTRMCIASVRFFYPEIPIRLLVGGRLQPGLAAELQKFWNVSTAELPVKGDYGWGFVKLEVLFGPPGERYLVLDSDTVLTGPVLDVWRDSSAPFLVDNESQSEEKTKAIYYDWEKVSKIDRHVQPPLFVFNTGQWFGTAGVLTRDDFAPWLTWTMPRSTVPLGHHERRARHSELRFNRKVALEGLLVDRREIMRWPARSMEGLDAETVSRRIAAPRIVHWAGLKKPHQKDMVGADLLAFFEKDYYDRLPVRNARKVVANFQNALVNWLDQIRISVRLASNRLANALLVKLGIRCFDSK